MKWPVHRPVAAISIAMIASLACPGPNEEGQDAAVADAGVSADSGAVDAGSDADATRLDAHVGTDVATGDGGVEADTASPPPASLFVSATAGDDSADCAQASPCKTLSHVLTVVVSGQTIYLENGTYSAASGETFDVPVPAGVGIEAVTIGGVVLLGQSIDTAFTLEGEATIRYLRLQGFNRGFVASAGTIELLHIEIDQTSLGISLDSSAVVNADQLTFTDGSMAFDLSGSARLSLANSSISGSGPNCGGGVGIGVLWEGAELELTAVTAENNYGSLSLRDTTQATLSNCTFVNNGSDACGRSTHIDMGEEPQLTLIDTDISGGPGMSIITTGIVNLVDGSIQHSVYGDANLTVNGTWFTGSGSSTAINVLPGGHLELSDATIENYGVGVFVDGASAIIRISTIRQNTTGIFVDLEGASLDMGILDGRGASPGLNTIVDNSDKGLEIFGAVAQTVYARGNTWNPNEDGTGSQGEMPLGSTLSGPSNLPGHNFRITYAEPTIQF